MPSFFEKINMGHHCRAHHVLTFIDKSLPKELLDVLHILLVYNFGENPKSICLEDIVVRQLYILLETTNDNEYLVLADV